MPGKDMVDDTDLGCTGIVFIRAGSPGISEDRLIVFVFAAGFLFHMNSPVPRKTAMINRVATIRTT